MNLSPHSYTLKNPKHDPADFMILLLSIEGYVSEDYELPPLLANADLRVYMAVNRLTIGIIV